jgi:hypothetical protein
VNVSTLVDTLVPASSDESLTRFAEIAIVDGGVRVRVTALDQLLASLTRRMLADGGEQTSIVLLPRGRQEVALLLGISSQILCRRPPAHLLGPVTVIASDVDLIGRLQALGVDGYRRIGLHEGNPLNAYRVRTDGTLHPAHGHELGDPDRSLLYLNTRIRWPDLDARRGLAVVDGTSITSPDSRLAAMKWADKHAEAIVVIGDLGDRQLVECVEQQRIAPLVLPMTWDDLSQLADELGTRDPAPSTLSTALLLRRRAPEVQLDLVEDPDIEEALLDGFEVLARTPVGPLPYAVSGPAALIRAGSRLLAHPEDYRTAAALDPANTVQSPRVLLRSLDRPFNPPPGWHTWRTAHWGRLVTSARSLWSVLEQRQPKLDRLWMLLERMGRDEEDTPIVIRCPSRAGATALYATLTHPRRTEAQVLTWEAICHRVVLARFADRLPWSGNTTEILSGSPPPGSFSLMVGGEATTIHVLVYRPEARGLVRLAEQWASQTQEWREEAARRLGYDVGGRTECPVPAPASPGGRPMIDPERFAIPSLSLGEILDRAMEGIDEREVETASGRLISVGAQRTLTPVRLYGGSTWWAPNPEQLVLMLTAGGQQNIAVKDLRRGDEIIVPTGDGNESVHARTIGACHRTADVAALDALLGQFREAARRVRSSARTQREAEELVRSRGAVAAGELMHWASGQTIAPHRPTDVAAVFEAAGIPCPDLRVLYEIANTLRDLHRTVGRLVSALRSRRDERAMAELRRMLGDVAEELVEEFAVHRVEAVAEAINAPAYLAGRITG